MNKSDDKVESKMDAEIFKQTKKRLELESERKMILKLHISTNVLLETHTSLLKEYCTLSDNGNQYKDNEVMDEVIEICDSYGESRKFLLESRKNFKDEIYRLSDEERLTNVEKEVIKKYKNIPHNAMRMLVGMGKQISDFASERFQIVLRAVQGDYNARQDLFKRLREFISQQVRLYKKRLKGTDTKQVKAFVHSAILSAASNWEKNKYLSIMEWIKGVSRRIIQDEISEIYQQREMEVSTKYVNEVVAKPEDEAEQVITDDEEEAYHEEAQEEVKLNKKASKKIVRHDDRIWINQAARRVGLKSPQTLRNWHKQGIFRAEIVYTYKRGFDFLGKPVIEEVKRYFYKETDIRKLIDIRNRNAQEQKHPPKDKNCWRTKYVVQLLGITMKRLSNWEKKGKLPKPKSDQYGKYYSSIDIRFIADKMNIELKKQMKIEPKKDDFPVKSPRRSHHFYQRKVIREI